MSGLFNILVLAILFSAGNSLLPPTWYCFRHHKIFPDIIPAPPNYWAYVTYGASLKVCGGNVLTPRQVKDEPVIRYGGKTGQFYTVAFLDPDLPINNNTDRTCNHWLVGNVPGNKIKAGDVIAEYLGPFPPKGSGILRYLFLVYEQPNKIDFKEPRFKNTSVKDRDKFSITEFAEKYKLNLFAGNFFKAEWDNYVPEVRKRLGLKPE